MVALALGVPHARLRADDDGDEGLISIARSGAPPRRASRRRRRRAASPGGARVQLPSSSQRRRCPASERDASLVLAGRHALPRRAARSRRRRPLTSRRSSRRRSAPAPDVRTRRDDGGVAARRRPHGIGAQSGGARASARVALARRAENRQGALRGGGHRRHVGSKPGARRDRRTPAPPHTCQAIAVTTRRARRRARRPTGAAQRLPAAASAADLQCWNLRRRGVPSRARGARDRRSGGGAGAAARCALAPPAVAPEHETSVCGAATAVVCLRCSPACVESASSARRRVACRARFAAREHAAVPRRWRDHTRRAVRSNG